MTSALTNQRQVFKACLTQIQTERVSDDVTRKIGPLDFNVGTHKKTRKQKLCKSSLPSSTKGEENRIEL